MINVHAPSYDQLLARSWRPSSEEEWITVKPHSYWDVADAGLAADGRSVGRMRVKLKFATPLGNTGRIYKTYPPWGHPPIPSGKGFR